MWPILKIDARTQTEAAPDEQTEMRCRSANQSLITDVLALRPYFCTIQLQRDCTAEAVWCQITAAGVLDGGHQRPTDPSQKPLKPDTLGQSTGDS